MATFTKTVLSGSSLGRATLVASNNTPGTAIHTTGISQTILDEIWMYAYNSDTTARLLTIQYGGTTSPDNDIKILIPSQSGLTLIVPGLILSGNGTAGSTVRAFASAANVITITGYVNRIS